MARYLRSEGLIEFPKTTMVGALCHYVSHAEPRHFQPMKANFGILPDLTDSIRNKRERYAAYAARALADLENVIRQIDIRQIDIVPVS
jgi:NAD(FAD)-utilizing enzyme possibly involved in translation